MANVIEIKVRATDETGPVYDAVRARAAAEGRGDGAAFTSAFASHVRGVGGQDIGQSISSSLAGAVGSGGSSVGADIGDQITDSISDSIGKDLPDKVRDPIKKSGSSSGAAFASAFQSNMDQSLSSSALSGVGQKQGEKFSVSFGQGAKDGMASANLSGILGDALGAGLEDSAPVEDALAPDSPAGEKIRDNAKKTGQQSAKDLGEGMSPVLMTALAGAASVAAPALLAGMGVAFAGVTALALKSNVVIANDFKTLGTDASSAFTSAAAPAAGTLHQALLGLEGTVQGLAPQLKGLFVNAEPDITAVVGGVGAFATNVLPGLSSAVKGSQVIVADFSNSLGGLGSSIGGMFQGMTRDAATTGAGLQSLVGVVGNLAQTLGGVLGSAASAGGAALMALDPVLNTTLTLVQKIANPGTVGAAGGLFAAMKFDPSISSGLINAAAGLDGYAKKAVTAEGEATRLGSAAGAMSGALEKGAGIMAGPWGLAIGAGVGLLSGLAGAIYSAAHASDALTLSQQGLQDAVAKDNGAMGASTAAYVAAQAQSDGLAKSAAAAGVSLETWTQAVLGNKEAQSDVTVAVTSANQVTQQAALASDEAAKSTGKFSDEQRGAATAAQGQAAANNTLTDKNKQLLNSMQAQHQQIVDAINKQRDLTAATNQLTNATDIFAASLKAQYQTQVASAQQSALNSVAALNLGDSQTALSQKIDQSETAYNLATAAAQGYGTALQALNGTTMSLDQAQNTLAQQMITAKTSFAANKQSLDLSTAAGVANRQALVNAAQAIVAMGVAQEQATGSVAQGNQMIQQQITAFVNATGATGKARTAILNYLESITQLPDSKTLHVGADTSSALNSLYSLINTIDNSSGHVRITGPEQASYGHGGNISAAATGGARGNLVQVGEYGRELVRLPYGSTVIPHSNVQSMAATSGGSASGSRSGVDVSFSGNTSDAVATLIMSLIRSRKIQIRMSQIQNN